MKKNFYKMIEEMTHGQKIKSKGGSIVILKSYGALEYDTTSEINAGMSVTALDTLNDSNEWELVEEFIEITLDEVADRLRDNKDVFIDTGKRKISRLQSLGSACINDFEDAFLLTHYFKKA